jgi:hypothetical protein
LKHRCALHHDDVVIVKTAKNLGDEPKANDTRSVEILDFDE